MDSILGCHIHTPLGSRSFPFSSQAPGVVQAKISVSSPCRVPECLQVIFITSSCLTDNLFRDALQLGLSIYTERWLLRSEWFGEEGETGSLDGGVGGWATLAYPLLSSEGQGSGLRWHGLMSVEASGVPHSP